MQVKAVDFLKVRRSFVRLHRLFATSSLEKRRLEASLVKTATLRAIIIFGVGWARAFACVTCVTDQKHLVFFLRSYFMGNVLQFQFHKAEYEAAGIAPL